VKTPPSSSSDYCVFLRGARSFALSTHLAKEVAQLRTYTPVARAPSELVGALNLRGEVVPLVRLDVTLGLDARPITRGDVLLLLESGDLRFAAAVDRVSEIRHLAPWEIRRDALAGSDDPLIRGVAGNAGNAITVLDGEAMIALLVRRVHEGFREAARPARAISASRSAPPGQEAPAAMLEES
jgi:purine-binding chemotaxis protein CheW